MIKSIKRYKTPFVILLVYICLLVFKKEMAFEALGNSSYYLLEMFQILPIIFMLTVAIDVLFPKEWIIKRLGNDSGISGNVLALTLGSISAGPIYAAFPIAKMLFNKGASINNIVIILSSWAVVKVPMLVNEIKFLGTDFMMVRWVLTVSSILVMSWIINRLSIKIDENDDVNKEKIYIKKEYCVGCGICQNLAPELYFMKDGKAYLKDAISVSGDYQEETIQLIEKTIEKCPTKSIILKEINES